MLHNRKGVIIIIDGLGDRPAPVLNGMTPLEAANTENFDKLVQNGICGLVDPFVAGMPVSTHTGTSLLMGIAPADASTLARGPIEAAGINLPTAPGSVTIRCNFATLEQVGRDFKVHDRRAGRISEEVDELVENLQHIELEGGIVASLHPASQHRAVLRLTGSGLSVAITDTDPGDASAPGASVSQCRATEATDAAERTANAVNQAMTAIFERIKNHPVNLRRLAKGLLPASGIITRSAGKSTQVRNLLQHLALRAAVVASERTVLGLTRLFKFTMITESAFTAMPDTDLAAKVRAVTNALRDHDIVFLHIKGTDVYGHDRDPQAKKLLIERIDRAIAPLLVQDIVIGVSADHSTDSSLGRHCGDPVPSLISSPNGRRDDCSQFGESQCMKGGLGRIGASGFLLSVLDLMGQLNNYKVVDKAFVSSN